MADLNVEEEDPSRRHKHKHQSKDERQGVSTTSPDVNRRRTTLSIRDGRDRNAEQTDLPTSYLAFLAHIGRRDPPQRARAFALASSEGNGRAPAPLAQLRK